MLSLLLSVFAPSSNAADANHPPGPTAQAEFSADDFDWREMVPYLFDAAALPGEQGIQAVLENFKVLRAYVANEVRTECFMVRFVSSRMVDTQDAIKPLYADGLLVS